MGNTCTMLNVRRNSNKTKTEVGILKQYVGFETVKRIAPILPMICPILPMICPILPTHILPTPILTTLKIFTSPVLTTPHC